MNEIPKSEYFLINIIKLPLKKIYLLIIILYLIYLLDRSFSIIGFIRFYIGNTFFSIFALWYSDRIYKNTNTIMEKWINNVDILDDNDKKNIIKELNRKHNVFFGVFSIFFSIIIVLIRRFIINFLNIEIGNIIIDSITIFLIQFLIITTLESLYYMHLIGSKGIKARYSFEIRNTYKELANLSKYNTIIIGTYLIIFGLAIVIWTYQYNINPAIYIIINFLILSGIVVVFYKAHTGIKDGISKTKQKIIADIRHDIYIYKRDDTDVDSFLKVVPILDFLLKKVNDVEAINEWLFFPKFSLTIISFISSTISISRFIYDFIIKPYHII